MVIANFFFILKIGCMIMNKSIIILKLNYVRFHFKNQTNLIFYALCFEAHFFSRTFTYQRGVDMYILKWLRWKSHKKCVLQIKCTRNRRYQEKMCVSKVTSWQDNTVSFKKSILINYNKSFILHIWKHALRLVLTQ